jgi:hypothetical protein
VQDKIITSYITIQLINMFRALNLVTEGDARFTKERYGGAATGRGYSKLVVVGPGKFAIQDPRLEDGRWKMEDGSRGPGPAGDFGVDWLCLALIGFDEEWNSEFQFGAKNGELLFGEIK